MSSSHQVQSATPSDEIPAPWIVGLMSAFAPGLGHAYIGRWRLAALFLLIALVALVTGHFLVAFSPWFMLIFPLLCLFFNVLVALKAYQSAKKDHAKSHVLFAGGYVVVAVLLYGWVCKPLFRVEYFVTTSTVMKPTLLPGDHFALDRFYKDYKNGDVVAVIQEDRSLQARRIQQMNSQTVIVVTDSADHTIVEELPLTSLRGRVLYVLYSVDPDTSSLSWPRLFLEVK